MWVQLALALATELAPSSSWQRCHRLENCSWCSWAGPFQGVQDFHPQCVPIADSLGCSHIPPGHVTLGLGRCHCPTDGDFPAHDLFSFPFQQRSVLGLREGTPNKLHLFLLDLPAKHNHSCQKLGLGHDFWTLTCFLEERGCTVLPSPDVPATEECLQHNVGWRETHMGILGSNLDLQRRFVFFHG